MKKLHKDELNILSITSLTEFGERYCYYFLQSLLILFLVLHFKLPNAKSASLVGTVLSVVYISAIVGGFIADKWLGHYRAAFCGALLMLAGSSIIALSTTLFLLYIGLAFIAMSTGLIKVNMSSLIGRFYDQSKLPESRRDFGFSVFYVGINLGAFISLFLASYLAKKFGYNAAFFSSIAINFIMLTVLIIGFFRISDYISDHTILLREWIQAVGVMLLYIIFIITVLNYATVANFATLGAAALCIVMLFQSAQKHQNTKHVIAASIFFVLSTVYWALYFQQFISIELFVVNAVEHVLFGITLSTTQFLAFGSIAILLLGYGFGRLWIWLDTHSYDVHDIDKFNIAFIGIFLVFLFLYVVISLTPLNQKVPALPMALFFFLVAPSELCLSAIGLSAVTKIAPEGHVGVFMSIWMVTLGVGGKLAGIMSEHIPMTGTLAESKHAMQQGLSIFMLCAIIASIACWLLRKKMRSYTA